MILEALAGLRIGRLVVSWDFLHVQDISDDSVWGWGVAGGGGDGHDVGCTGIYSAYCMFSPGLRCQGAKRTPLSESARLQIEFKIGKPL